MHVTLFVDAVRHQPPCSSYLDSPSLKSPWNWWSPRHQGRVASPLLLLRLLLPAEVLAAIRIVFNEEDEGGGEGESETAGAQEEHDVPEVMGNVGGREWSNLATAGESKGEREQGRRRVVSSRLVSGRTALSSVVSRRSGPLTCWE